MDQNENNHPCSNNSKNTKTKMKIEIVKASNRRSVEKWNSYSVTFLKISILMLQSFIFIGNNTIKSELYSNYLSYSINVLERFSTHVLPLIWVLTHQQIRNYFLHKLTQMKNNIFN